MKRVLAAAALFLALASSVPAIQLKGQVVTWADFNFVRSVTSSVNKVYFATTNGIIRYNKLERRWEEPLTGAEGLEGQQISRIWVERFDDRLYAQTNEGYYELDITFDRWYPMNDAPRVDNPITHVDVPEDLLPPPGSNYLGQGQLTNIGGQSYSVREVINDNSGDLWMGTWGFGPAKASAGSHLMEFLPYGPLSDNVNTLVRVDSSLWMSGLVGTSARTGITIFNVPKDSFSYLESGQTLNFPRTDITALAVTDSLVFAGTYDGLLEIDRKSQQVLRHITGRGKIADDEVLSLAVVGDSLFIGTNAGLSLLNFAKDSVMQVYPKVFFNNSIYDMERDSGYLWIGSSVGAYRLTLATNEMSHFQAPSNFLLANVFDLTKDGSGLWMGSEGGLLRVDLRTGAIQTYREVWRPNMRRVIAANDRIAAITSARGFTIFFLDQKDHSREFSTDDGLPSGTVYTLLLDGDYLWVGSDHGLTRFLWNNPQRVD